MFFRVFPNKKGALQTHVFSHIQHGIDSEGDIDKEIDWEMEKWDWERRRELERINRQNRKGKDKLYSGRLYNR